MICLFCFQIHTKQTRNTNLYLSDCSLGFKPGSTQNGLNLMLILAEGHFFSLMNRNALSANSFVSLQTIVPTHTVPSIVSGGSLNPRCCVVGKSGCWGGGELESTTLQAHLHCIQPRGSMPYNNRNLVMKQLRYT